MMKKTTLIWLSIRTPRVTPLNAETVNVITMMAVNTTNNILFSWIVNSHSTALVMVRTPAPRADDIPAISEKNKSASITLIKYLFCNFELMGLRQAAS